MANAVRVWIHADVGVGVGVGVVGVVVVEDADILCYCTRTSSLGWIPKRVFVCLCVVSVCVYVRMWVLLLRTLLITPHAHLQLNYSTTRLLEHRAQEQMAASFFFALKKRLGSTGNT